MDYQGVMPKVGPLGFHHLEVLSLCQFLTFHQGAVDMKINVRVGATEMEAGFH